MKSLILIGMFLFLVSCSSKVSFQLPMASDNFAQDIKYNKKVDILFIVDNTYSMGVVQQSILNQLPYLTKQLQDLDMDYHIGAVTTSVFKDDPLSGKLIGTPKYITNKDKNLNELLKSKIIVGEGGSIIEQGLDAMTLVLSDDYQKTEGEGFLRSDSFLNIIALSNEDDQSTNGWTNYAEFLDKLRPNYADGSKSWAFHFFGVLSFQDNCSSGDWNYYKSPGFKFLELVNYSKGFSGSLCSNEISKSLTNIKARIIQVLTDYKLEKLPVISSISVSVNDHIVPQDSTDGWQYIEGGNLIRFYGSAIPAANATIKVDFKPREAN